MRQLIWKDYRLTRPVLIVAFAVFVAIYGLGAAIEIQGSWPKLPSAAQWGSMLVAYGTIALYMTFIVTALLGGHAIACERADRSAHFLAYLPPTKLMIISSKLIVAAAATAVMFGWIVLTACVLAPRLGAASAEFTGGLTVRGAAMTCVLTFGVGWLASAKFDSALVPIILAVASPVVVTLALLTLARVLDIPNFEMAARAGPTCLWLGVIAFAAGTWLYARRVEP